MKLTTAGRESKEYHWFISTVDCWVADSDLMRGLNRIKRETSYGHEANIWRVEGPVTREYDIEFYAPAVEDKIYVGYTTVRGKVID